MRELEEQAKRSIAEIDGVAVDLADTMFKLGWRSAEDVANTPPEELMAIPGLGGFTLEGIQSQDFRIVGSMVYLGSFLYIVGLIMTDISYTLVDPRVRLK